MTVVAPSAHSVLVVEDDQPLREALADTLRSAGFRVRDAGDGREALELVAVEDFDLVVTDVQMKPVDGCELLRRLRHERPALPVLMMTAYGTIEQAVNAMRDGAADYLVKPFEASELEQQVLRHLAQRRPGVDEAGLVARDPRTLAAVALARKVASTDVTVLLNGESGTGKEVFARFIHRNSSRAAGPFVAVNCAAIPEQMLEAILFGHEKGAFTGAQARTIGKFQQAAGGTLLLDEITEMPVSLQSKLLRALQEREVEPLGAAAPQSVDVRVIATTNRNLERAVTAGEFRQDLYYRLSVFPLTIPPLRERPGDVDVLTDAFVEHHAGRPVELTPDARNLLSSHDWPGNVRELGNVVQRALVLAQGEQQITSRHFSLAPAGTSGNGTSGRAEGLPQHNGLADELWEEEARRVVAALETFGGSRKRAAEHLNVSARTLRYKLAKLRDAGWSVPASGGA
jgi:two-component system response regulator FlrC